MKKLFLLLLLLPMVVYSQEKEPETKSKSIEFMSKDGAFIKKEFYDLGKIKGVTCQVLILSDMVAQKKVGCLRLETSYISQYSSDTYVGTLDSDELEACIKSLNYLVSEILPSQPTIYTEAEYKTRDGVRFGAFNDLKKGKWSAFVYTKSYTSRSAEFFDSTNISELIKIMEAAKVMIAEKIN
jgi:hypothetical protein